MKKNRQVRNKKKIEFCAPFFSTSSSSLLLTFHFGKKIRHVYIYDDTGTEIHLLKHHVDPLKLDFLRYHFLLVSVGNAGFLKYQVGVGILIRSAGCLWKCYFRWNVR